MEHIGQKYIRGFSKDDLLYAKNYLKTKGCESELILLHNLIPEKDLPK